MPSATSTTCQHMENEPYVSSTQTFPYRLPKSCSPISWNTCIHTVQSKKRASNLVNLNPSLLEGENDAKRRCFIFCKTCNSGAGDFGSLALALSLSLFLSLCVSPSLSLSLSIAFATLAICIPVWWKCFYFLPMSSCRWGNRTFVFASTMRAFMPAILKRRSVAVVLVLNWIVSGDAIVPFNQKCQRDAVTIVFRSRWNVWNRNEQHEGHKMTQIHTGNIKNREKNLRDITGPTHLVTKKEL